MYSIDPHDIVARRNAMHQKVSGFLPPETPVLTGLGFRLVPAVSVTQLLPLRLPAATFISMCMQPRTRLNVLVHKHSRSIATFFCAIAPTFTGELCS